MQVPTLPSWVKPGTPMILGIYGDPGTESIPFTLLIPPDTASTSQPCESAQDNPSPSLSIPASVKHALLWGRLCPQ